PTDVPRVPQQLLPGRDHRSSDGVCAPRVVARRHDLVSRTRGHAVDPEARMNVVAEAFVWLNDPLSWTGPGGVLALTAEHLGMTAAAVLLATGFAVPLGAWLGHTGRGASALIWVVNSTRAMPTL